MATVAGNTGLGSSGRKTVARESAERDQQQSMWTTVRSTCSVRTQTPSCSSDSLFRRRLSGTTGHRLLGTQRSQMLWLNQTE